MPEYDYATQTANSPILPENITNRFSEESFALATQIQEQNTPERLNLSMPLYGSQDAGSLWQSNEDTRPSLVGWETSLDSAYTQLNDGTYISRFENYIGGTNNEERLALQQGAGEKLFNGLTKFGAKTLLNVFDGTVGSVDAAIQGVSKGSLEAVYNSDFRKWVDDLNTKLDSKLPSYYTQQQAQRGAWAAIPFTDGSMNFWSDKILGGLSFVTGTVVSEALWATATGGSSIATMGARAALKGAGKKAAIEGAEMAAKNQNKVLHSITKMMDSYQRTIPASNIGKALNNTRFLYTSAGYESAVEARHALKEAESNYIDSYVNTHGKRPSGEELAEFRKEASNMADGVFLANFALVGASNIAQYGTIFGVGGYLSTKGLNRGFNRSIGIGVNKTFDGAKDVYKAIDPTRAQRILGNTYQIFKSPLREGFIEEGGQGVIGDFGQRYIAAQFDPTAMQDNFSVMEAMKQSLAHTYGTKEGLEEVFIGSIIGGISNVKSGFGIGQYNKELEAQKEIAAARTLNSDYNILRKMVGLTAQKSAKQKAESTDDGVIANQELNMAMFAKFEVDDTMGLLDNSAENFATSLNQLPVQELAEQLDVSLEEATQAKENAILAHTEALADYKQASRVAQSIFSEGTVEVIDGKKIPASRLQSMLALNIYMAKKSDGLAQKYAQEIENLIGDNGVASALSIQTTLASEDVNKRKEVDAIDKELKALDQALNKRNEELIKITAKPRTEAGDSRLEAFENRRQELLDQEQRDTNRRSELKARLDQIAFDVKNAVKAQNIANSAIGGQLKKADVTADSLLEAVNKLNSLSSTLYLWEESGQQAAAEDVAYLIDQFDKASRATLYANDAYNKLIDPRFRTQQTRSIFGRFFEKAKKAGATANDYDQVNKELYTIIANQYAQMQTTLDVFRAEETTTDTQQTETEGDDLVPIPSRDSIRAIKDFYNAERAALEQPMQIEVEPEYEPGDYQKVQDLVLNVIAGNDTNTPENLQLLTNYPKLFESFIKSNGENLETSDLSREQYEQKLAEIDRREQEELAQLFNNVQQQATTKREKLNALANTILQGRKGINAIAPVTPKPTQAETEEYKKLYERNRRSRNGLKPKDRQRFEELKDKLNNWGRAIGTVEGGIRLSDIYEQIANLDEITTEQTEMPVDENGEVIEGAEPVAKKPVIIKNDTNEEEIRARMSIASDANGNQHLDKTQFWEKASFTKNEDGTYTFYDINLEGLLNEINRTDAAVVLLDKKNGAKNNRKETDKLTGSDYKEGDKFIIKLRSDSEVKVAIGKRGRIVINEAGVDILNKETALKAIPSTQLATNYQPLLFQSGENNEVSIVESNLETETNLPFTDITDSPDNTEMSLFVSMRAPYNIGLVQDYRAGRITLTELQNQLLIYSMNAQGQLGGVLKSLGGEKLIDDENYTALAEIRRVATERALESNLDNEMIDVQISVPTNRGASYFGKPNYNMRLTPQGTLTAELIPLTDTAMGMIVDYGYVENGKLTLKQNQKGADKIYTGFFKKIPSTHRMPIIVFEYNGSRIAYPVSMVEIENTLAEQLQEILDAPLSTVEKVNDLNNFLHRNGINPNIYGFTTIEGINEDHVQRVKDMMSEQRVFMDFQDWMGGTFEDGKALVQQSAQINIDITNNPFHSPKLALRLKEATFIGGKRIPQTQIPETVQEKPQTKVVRVADDTFKKFANATTQDPVYKTAMFMGNEVDYVVTDQEDDFSGDGASFAGTWDVAKYNQGSFAHVRILMTPEQKAMQTTNGLGYSNSFHNQLKDLARSIRDVNNVVIVDIRPKTTEIRNLAAQVETKIAEKTCE